MFIPIADEKLKPLTVNLTEKELKKIQILSEKYKCKRSTLVRQLVQQFIDEHIGDNYV